METLSERDRDRQEERLRRLTAAVPYFLLAASTLLSLASDDLHGSRLLETLGLVSLTAVLMWAMTGLNPEWTSRQGPMTVFVAVLIVMIALVSTRGVWFAGFFGFAGYVYSWQFLRGGWRFVGVAATAAVTVAAYMGGPPALAPASVLLYLGFVASIVLLVAVFSHLGEFTAERSDERRRMVERLRTTLRENEGLQAQLLLQAREAGVHDERERMAREIHDTLAQGFVGIITQLQAAERAELEETRASRGAVRGDGIGGTGEGDRAEWRLRVANATRLARENLAEARRSVHALGPAPLETTPLPDALSDLIVEWSRMSGVHSGFTLTGPARPLHTEVETTLLRAVQESLSNVARHAEAARVGVTLSYTDDLVLLDVRDDGVGFDPAAVGALRGGTEDTTGGFGLTSVRQRVGRLAGTVRVESEPGHGTALSIAVPAVPRETPVE